MQIYADSKYALESFLRKSSTFTPSIITPARAIVGLSRRLNQIIPTFAIVLGDVASCRWPALKHHH